MKRFFLLFPTFLFIVISGCQNRNSGFQVINSVSFPENQVALSANATHRLMADSVAAYSQNHSLQLIDSRLSHIGQLVDEILKNPSGSLWNELNTDWESFRSDAKKLAQSGDSTVNSDLSKWADLNTKLLRFSGEAKFAEAFTNLLYSSTKPVLSSNQLKQTIYTHVFDEVFIHIPIASAVSFQHTTGGTIRLIQETNYPEGNEITLKCECSDTRFLDVFIRIPPGATNPSVTHGNVKYVARPGEYCQITRKWKNGDEFVIRLKN